MYIKISKQNSAVSHLFQKSVNNLINNHTDSKLYGTWTIIFLPVNSGMSNLVNGFSIQFTKQIINISPNS